MANAKKYAVLLSIPFSVYYGWLILITHPSLVSLGLRLSFPLYVMTGYIGSSSRPTMRQTMTVFQAGFEPATNRSAARPHTTLASRRP